MTEQTSYAYGYARMPRIIRKGYKNLTKLQKLLYIYLRDLAGEDGTCYRSLRTLQEETGFSIGYLSENIPILHNEGLIHAEMKSSSQTHWQVWHITIVDIWEKNAAFLQSEKCSPDEQLTEQSVHQMNSSVHGMNSSPESVHAVNESVHAVTLNKNHTKNQLIEKKDREEREEVAIATARSQSSSQNVVVDEQTVPITYAECVAYLQQRGIAIESDAVQVMVTARNLYVQQYPYATLPPLDTDKTEKREAVKPSQKDVAQNGHAHQHPIVDHHSPVGLHQSQPSQPEHRKDTNRNTDPPHPRKPPTNPVPRRPKQQGLMDEIPSLPASKPVEPLADMPWGTRKCLQWFDYWRGGTLIAKYKLQQAANCAKGLAEQFDEKTVVEVYGDMAADQYYIDRGGPDVCDVANNIHKYINKKKPKKEPSNEHKVVSQYSPKALYEKNKWKADAMIAAYEAQEAAKQGVQS